MANTSYLKEIRESLKILEHDDFCYVPIQMSESIYFNYYPYKIEFEHQIFDNRRSLRDFYRELEDFVDDFGIFSYRFHISKNKQRVYLGNKHELISFVNMYHSKIKNVSGPVSDEHVEMLCDPNMLIEVAPKYFYNKYNCKVSCVSKKRYSMGASMYSFASSNYSDRIDRLTQDIESACAFVSENLENIKLVSSFPFSTNFFCDYNEFKLLIPFLNIQQDTLNFFVTKRFLRDK